MTKMLHLALAQLSSGERRGGDADVHPAQLAELARPGPPTGIQQPARIIRAGAADVKQEVEAMNQVPVAEQRVDTGSGPGRLIVAVYAVFAVSAGARSGVQIATRFAEAPLAYLLSALAAAVYLVAAVALARSAWTVALAACAVELVGVLAVGTASLIATEAFPDATVWSDYGIGYGFVPLVLPVVGLLWLYRARPGRFHRARPGRTT